METYVKIYGLMPNKLEMKHIKIALTKYGDTIVELMKADLVRNKKVATGNLVNEMKSYVEEEDDRAFLYVDMPSYGRYVDSGRKPNSKLPPVKSIRDWVKIKGIRSSNPRTSQEQLVYLIRRAIGIRGVPAVPFLDIWETHYDELEDIIANAALEDLEDEINDFVDEFNKNN